MLQMVGKEVIMAKKEKKRKEKYLQITGEEKLKCAFGKH